MKFKHLILILIAFTVICTSFTCQKCQHVCDENCIYDGNKTCTHACISEIDPQDIWWPDI